jgi:hypothetical protein
MNNQIYRYYLKQQQGGGLQDIGPIYRSPRGYQLGRGNFSNFFSGILRYLRPLVSSGLDVLKNEALTTGSKILTDMTEEKPIKEILKNRGEQALQNITNQAISAVKKKTQLGTGYKRKRTRRSTFSLRPAIKKSKRKRKAVKTKRKSTKRKNSRKRKSSVRTLDIFS